MRVFALIAVLLASSPASSAVSTDAERAQAAQRLADVAQRALDGMLGPGRAQVRVEVQGESSEIDSETESVLPITKSPQADLKPAHQLDLPGYVKPAAAEPPKDKPEQAPSTFFQKDQEHSLHDAGFQIKSIQATVILDTALDDAVVREAAQLLPQVLKLDTPRGDTLSLLRAPLRPAWKSAFATPGDWRTAAYATGAGLVALLVVLILGMSMIGSGRALGKALGRELASRSPESTTPPAGELLPELSPGAGGLLEDGTEDPEAPAGETPLLGRRFDFLTGRDPELIARALAAEKPEDLSLFFGHLAESIPDLASRLFAHLPPGVQAEVSQSLLKLSMADPERLTAIEERLRTGVENGVVGPQSLGRILSRVPEDARADLLGRLAVNDKRGVEEVEKHLFSFEDLSGVGVAPLRRLLGAVPYDVWGLALRGAPSVLADQILADLPEGPREAVRAALGEPQPREKVAEARSQILDAFSALVEKGDVVLDRAAASGDMV